MEKHLLCKTDNLGSISGTTQRREKGADSSCCTEQVFSGSLFGKTAVRDMVKSRSHLEIAVLQLQEFVF